VTELYDEKIDIVRWNADTGMFIGEALSPAKAVKVTITEETKSALWWCRIISCRWRSEGRTECPSGCPIDRVAHRHSQ